jgi:excisionase family DNA binding protein
VLYYLVKARNLRALENQTADPSTPAVVYALAFVLPSERSNALERSTHPLDLFAGYVTLKQAADRLGTSRDAIYAYLKRHRIPHRKAGRTIMIRLSNLADMRVPAGGRAWNE